MDSTPAATALPPKPIAFVTLPSIASKLNASGRLKGHITADSLARQLPLLGIQPDGVVQYGNRLIPIFTPARADSIAAWMTP